VDLYGPLYGGFEGDLLIAVHGGIFLLNMPVDPLLLRYIRGSSPHQYSTELSLSSHQHHFWGRRKKKLAKKKAGIEAAQTVAVV
jgi:hypothetical protein